MQHFTQDTVPDLPPDKLPSMAYRSYFLFVMVLVSACVVSERYILFVLVEPIRRDLGLTDFQIGLVKDLALAIVYIVAVVPFARLSGTWSKKGIVAGAAAVWSVSVLVCAYAKNFWVLLLGRAGIGMGDGAFTPPSQAWIADLFPPKQRGTALSIFLLGASLGAFAGPSFGGWAAHAYGWREALLLASIPGFVLVPIVWFTLRDVRPGLADGSTANHLVRQPFGVAFRELMAIRTFPLLVGASALNTLLTMGMISWAPAFMERTHGMAARDAGVQMGGALFIGSLVGHLLGGPLADLLGRRNVRWYLWVPMISGALAVCVGLLILTGPASRVFPLFGLQLLIGGLAAAPLMAVVTGLAPVSSRSTAVAILMVAINVIGLGGGPVFVGWLSDALHPVYGENSLGMAMRWSMLAGIPSTILAYLASRTYKADAEAARARLAAGMAPMGAI
ncbi:spinster family MFS transporter [Sphingomonas ginsenosidivorax]|uniref:spinster family MFS transporter n=1 Tax=Sphingomonas ginsenosidivorax TaxID=862135 RepID=UPI001F551DF4|nr:MFS transporter [Sphingomonas ginsenosidivorax]